MIGQHQGLSFYTLGQRQGLGIGGVKEKGAQRGGGEHAPWFVARKDMEKNTLWVVQGHDHPWLQSLALEADDASWIAGEPPAPGSYAAKTRYRQADAPCVLRCRRNGGFQLDFDRAAVGGDARAVRRAVRRRGLPGRRRDRRGSALNDVGPSSNPCGLPHAMETQHYTALPSLPGESVKQLLYNIDATLITGVLFVLMLAAIEAGYRFGVRRKDSATEMTRDHLSAIQASILGLMGLLLAFTFSLSVQRFDTRSDAAVDEANAIGTAYLRTQLLPPALRSDVQMLLRDYVDLRVQASEVSMVSKGEWEALQAKVAVSHAALWDYARRAAELNPNPVISGLFIQALNEMIDSYGRNVAQVSRQVPQPVLILLFGTLLVAGGVVGLTAGSGGQRPSLASFAMITLILGLTFVILDLDRPQRGRITVSNQSLLDLQASIKAQAPAASPPPAAAARPASGAQR